MRYKYTWLLVDTNYLCYRAYHSIPDLTHEGEATGVIYGVLQTLKAISTSLYTNRIVFCFDGAHNKRYDLYPEYKGNRTRPDGYEMFKAQVDKLPEILRDADVPNVYRLDHYEADDIMAGIAAAMPKNHEGVVWMHKPRKGVAYTLDKFREEYAISPEQWRMVKAWAGCSSDNIPGVKGVGEKTAIKYLLGQLQDTSKAAQAIAAFDPSHNLKLVTLPIDDGAAIVPKNEGMLPEHWDTLAKRLGSANLGGRRAAEKNKGFGV